MWKSLIGCWSRYESLCDKMWDYLKCQSVFEASVCFIEKQILYFRVQTGSLDRLQTLINQFLLSIPLFCKSLPLLFKHLLIGQLVNLLPSNFPAKFYLCFFILQLYLVFGYFFFILKERNKMKNITLKLLVLFFLYQGNNSYLINDIIIFFPNATTYSYDFS